LEPEQFVSSPPLFFGFLHRISHYRIETPTQFIEFKNEPDDEWDSDRCDTLAAVRDYVVANSRRDSEE